MALTGCGDDSILDPTYKVSGIITDEFTQQPLDNALVQLHEDMAGPFMGSKVIREVTTNHTGQYDFKFEWKEGPYKIVVTRPQYGYFKLVKGTGPLPDRYVNFRSLDGYPFKKSEKIDFAMEAYGTLQIKIKNTGSASHDDVLNLQLENIRKNLPTFIHQPIRGQQEQNLELTDVAGNHYVRLKYAVTAGGVTKDFKDSIFIKPFVDNIFELNY